MQQVRRGESGAYYDLEAVGVSKSGPQAIKAQKNPRRPVKQKAVNDQLANLETHILAEDIV